VQAHWDSLDGLEAVVNYPLLDLFWSFVWFFALVLWFWLLIRVFGDLFGRDDIGGWGKTGWSIFVIFLPFIGVFTYLIAQGRAIADRDARRAQAVKRETDEYIRSVAAGNNPAGNGHAGNGRSGVDEIARARQLLDNGTITPNEFAQLKQRTLA
jgi:Phospholipase_D-nuclease N-terminal